MKKLILICLIFTTCFGQTTRSKAKVEPDPEERWACQLDHNTRVHKCQCPAMVSDAQQEYINKCELSSKSVKDYAECMMHMPGPCAIIQKVDTKHPENTCTRSCSKPRCRCHDGPACFGPYIRNDQEIVEP